MKKKTVIYILIIAVVAVGALLLIKSKSAQNTEVIIASEMEEVDLSVLGKEDVIDLIANQWMLITAGTNDSFNTMTASWGGIGNLWNKPVAFIFVRPDRYTHQFIENNERVTLSFYDPIYREALRICGSKSGRDTDKVAEAGLIPFELESGAMTFAQSRLTIDGCKIYQAEIGEDGFNDWSIFEHWYGSGVEPHTMYIIEIEKLYVPVK